MRESGPLSSRRPLYCKALVKSQSGYCAGQALAAAALVTRNCRGWRVRPARDRARAPRGAGGTCARWRFGSSVIGRLEPRHRRTRTEVAHTPSTARSLAALSPPGGHPLLRAARLCGILPAGTLARCHVPRVFTTRTRNLTLSTQCQVADVGFLHLHRVDPHLPYSVIGGGLEIAFDITES